MQDLVAILISLTALITGSVTDFKKREVPDWVNYGLMFTGFGLALISSIIYKEFAFIIHSIAGFLFFFLLGTLLFYTGQWGGGDTKMLMGLGAVIGIEIPSKIPATLQETPFIILFVGFTLVAGAAYGLIWILYMAVKKRHEFMVQLKKKLREKQIIYLKYLCIFFVLLMLTFSFIADDYLMHLMFLIIGLAFPVLFYLSISIRIIENVCMIKKISPERLTEGDWIEEEILENKTKFLPRKILTEDDVQKIRKKQRQYYVKIKRKKMGMRFSKEVHVSELKKGDILLQSITKPVKLSKGELKQKDIDKLKQHGKYKFSTPKVKKKLLFFTRTREFDEDSASVGDELLGDLYFGEYISGPKDLGISKENIQKLIKYHEKGTIKKVTIKEGIPFVPSFLLAFILTLLLIY